MVSGRHEDVEKGGVQIQQMADDGRPISQVLHQAIATGDLDTVQALLQKGVNANSTLVARCPLDARYSLSIDTNKQQHKTKTNDLTRYSLGVDRCNGISGKGFSKEAKGFSIDRIDNNNLLDYNCREIVRETPIVESDYEDNGIMKKSVKDTESSSRKPFNKDDVVTKLNEMNDILNKLSDHNSKKSDRVSNNIMISNVKKPDVLKPNKYVDNDEGLRDLLEKCTEDVTDEKPLISKIPQQIEDDVIGTPKQTMYCEEVFRSVTPLFPSTTADDNALRRENNADGMRQPKTSVTSTEKRHSKTSVMTSDKRDSKTSVVTSKNRDSIMTTEGEEDILIERPPSIILDPRAHSEELLLEEKPLKLIPKLKKKLSNRWKTKDHAIRENKLGEKYVIDKQRNSRHAESSRHTEKRRNVDNEQLKEIYDGLAFFEAVRYGMDMTVQTLLETSNNNQLNMADENGFSPLMQAAWHGQEECLRVLLDHGANVSLRNNAGCTATHFAAAQGQLRCLDVLINYAHVDVNSQTKFSATPLILAAKGGHHQCVSLLLEHGADVNMQYRGNQNALLFAAGNGHYDTMEILIANGVVLDQANSQGVTPLMRAIQQGHNACAQLLLSRNEVNVNLQDVIGRAPVHFAIEHDNPEGLELLIASGAYLDVETHGGSTPMDYLERFPSVPCASLLNTHVRAKEEQMKKEMEKDEEKKNVSSRNLKKKKTAKQPSCVCLRRGRSKGRDGDNYSDDDQ